MIIEQENFGKTIYMKVGEDGERETISQKEIDSYIKNPFKNKDPLPQASEIGLKLIQAFYATKEGKIIPSAYEKIEQVLELPLKTKFKIVGIILSNTIKRTRNDKIYRRIKVEYKDGVKSHNVFNNDIHHGKHCVCVFTGNVDEYKGQPELRIGSGELLITQKNFKDEINSKE